MVWIEASEQELAPTLTGHDSNVALAAINGPAAVVISGEQDTVLEIAAGWAEKGRNTKRLRVSHAFHSPLIDAILDDLAAVAERVDFHAPQIPIISNLTGTPVPAEQLCSADYWVRQAREPVRFLDGLRWLEREAVTSLVELGPDGTLTAMAQQCLEANTNTQSAAVALLHAKRSEPQALLTALAELWISGVNVTWPGLFSGLEVEPVPLPPYAFQRDRYWLAVSHPSAAGPLGLNSAGHPLLGAYVELAERDQWLFSGQLSTQTHPWLADHTVAGTVLLPAAAFIDLALHAAATVGCEQLAELTLETPLALSDRATQLQVVVGEPDSHEQRPITIFARPLASSEDPGEHDWTRHASGLLKPRSAKPGHTGAQQPLAGDWPPPGGEQINLDGIYDRFADLGLEYGPTFQGLTGAWRAGEDLYAEVSLPEQADQQAGRFSMHPALLDAALQTIAVAAAQTGEPQPLRLPFACSAVTLAPADTSRLRVRVTRNATPGGATHSLLLADANGTTILTIESLLDREVSPTKLAGTDQSRALTLTWQSAPLPNARPQSSLILLGGDRRLAERVGLPAQHPDLASVTRTLAAGDAADVLSIHGRLADPTEDGGPLATAHRTATATLGLLQQWLAEPRLANCRLVLLTSGAIRVDGGEDPIADLGGGGVWGLVRAAQSEHPQRFVLIDIDREQSSLDALPEALASGEPQLAIRAGRVLAPRLARSTPAERLALPSPGEPWRLAAASSGSLEHLAATPADDAAQPLADGQVRVAVRAAGLNFRDVLIALGSYPAKAVIGGEAAGVITEVAAGVERLTVGDRVMGLLGGAFGPLAIGDHRMLAKIPDGWTFTQAASIPVVFLTAYHALVEMARLQSGERLLIHAGAGGVGMAAVQVAQHLGAEVFATASEQKWPALRALGLDDQHIASSRELTFEEQFLTATAGDGVDVVLNSLANDFVDASLRLLPRGGRFLEIGKSDIRDPTLIADSHPTVTYRTFDLADLDAPQIEQTLERLLSLFDAGTLEPLPLTVWDVREARKAFRLMSTGRHVGKNVLSLPAAIDPHTTILITGGTGALGARLAKHLAVEHHIKHLLLASRRGADAPGASELRDTLETLGVNVTITACDTSNRDELAGLLAAIPEKYPLRGIVHAAAVLDDAVIESLTAKQLQRVLAAKADAAWHLHELTSNLDLAIFVLFSSAAGLLGSPGQASYAAANSLLDTLATLRRQQGLPATSIAWGPWSATDGMTATLARVDRARIERSGLRALSPQRGLELFDALHNTVEVPALAIDLDSRALREQATAGTLPRLLESVTRTTTSNLTSRAEPPLAQRLAGADDKQRERSLLELICNEAARVLGHSSPEQIEPERTFKELGFESLTAVELRNRVNAASGLRLATAVLFDYPTPRLLCAHLLTQLQPDPTASNSQSDEHTLRTVLAEVPIERLREAGLIEPIIALADPRSEQPAPAGSVELTDADSLVQAALALTGTAN
jgi:mycoketide-CoA synthase